MSERGRSDLTWLVALAASLWGVSALFRDPLLRQGLSPALIVLCEHAVLAVVTVVWLMPALRRLAAATWRTKIAVLVIGAGSSALATTLFTAAFAVGDPITPQVLQKLQPLFALALAAVLLRERLRPRFWFFAVPTLAGAWLLAFPRPLAVDVASVQAALLAVGAAALWAAGTVLGRLTSAELSANDLTSLRFTVGLLTMIIIVSVLGAWEPVPLASVPYLLALALVSGLLALSLYYRALRRTAASRATLAELAFPLSAALVGVVVLGRTLQPTQWIGFAIVLISVTALSINEHRAKAAAVQVPQDEPVVARTTTRCQVHKLPVCLLDQGHAEDKISGQGARTTSPSIGDADSRHARPGPCHGGRSTGRQLCRRRRRSDRRVGRWTSPRCWLISWR